MQSSWTKMGLFHHHDEVRALHRILIIPEWKFASVATHPNLGRGGRMDIRRDGVILV